MLDSQRVTAPLSLRTRSGEPLHGLGPRRQPTHLSPTKLRYGRFSTISCAAQPSSRAREHSVARTLAPQRHAPASQRHAGVQLMLLTADPSRLLRPSADQPTDLAKPLTSRRLAA